MKRWLGLLLIVLALSCVACVQQEEVEGEGGYLLYFPADLSNSRGGDAITSVRVDLDVKDDPELVDEANAIIMALMKGTEEYPSPFGEDIYLRGLTIVGRRAYVDFSPRYAELTGIALSLADYCVTLSLTELENISAVSITAGGKELFYHPNQVMMERDVLFSDMEDVIESVEVMLYFLNAEGELVPERRVLELYEGQTLSESLISALMAGPLDRELSPLIPEEFVVNGIRVENRICYLSLPAKTLEILPAGMEQQTLLLRSIAGSIYSMDTVDEICILADGEELESFGVVSVDTIRFRPDEPEE